MANTDHAIKQRSTHGNAKVFAALRDGTGIYGDVGANDGSAIVAQTYWWRYVCKVDGTTIGAVSLVTGATTVAINLHTAFPSHLFPEKVVIHQCVLKLMTAFSGGAVSAAVASVGEASANVDEWIDAQDIFTGASTTPETDQADADATEAVGAFTPYRNAYVPILTIDTTSANTDAITAGELEVWFLVTELPDF
jgi:hypothetical protein